MAMCFAFDFDPLASSLARAVIAVLRVGWTIAVSWWESVIEIPRLFWALTARQVPWLFQVQLKGPRVIVGDPARFRSYADRRLQRALDNAAGCGLRLAM